MATTVLPTVSLIWPCTEAHFEVVEERWVIVNPWTGTMELPQGAAFPFKADDVWVYVQLSGGLGTVDLGIEVLQLRDDGSRRQIGVSGAIRQLRFTAADQLIPLATAFRLRQIPFRTEGIYEFRLIAEEESGGWQALNGSTAQVRILEPWGTL